MKIIVSILFAMWSTSVFAGKLTELKFITESYPPYNYQENGKLMGMSVDILEAATKAAGDPVMRKDVKVQPWARGYAAALSGPKVALFATTRTTERESKFKWVGPISDTKVVIFSAKDITVNGAEDLNNYRIGAVRDDIGEQLLKQLGVKASSIKLQPKADLLVKQLGAGRIDMLAYEENVASYLMRSANIDKSKFKVVYVLSESQLYYSLSSDTPDDYVSMLQGGIDSITSSGVLAEIKSKY